MEEIAEFWDTHSLADYWDETRDVTFEVRVNKKSADSHEPILQADDALFQLAGAMDTGYGNYTEEREALLADLTLDDIVAEIKRKKANE